MITIEQLIQYALEHNLRFDCFSTVFDMHGRRTVQRTYTGIMLKDFVWYWWESFSDNNCYFDHRYNQNNGVTIKGSRTGYKAETKIINYLNSL